MKKQNRVLEKEMLARSVPKWWHSIKLGDGVTTKGQKTPEVLAGEVTAMKLPELVGNTVLDIGAWDGFFSFYAEEQGAKRVVALDHFAWTIDWEKAWSYLTEATKKGKRPKHVEAVPRLWRTDLAGKRGFDIAH